MDNLPIILFCANILLVLIDATLGYCMAPHLLIGLDDPEAVEAGVRRTRSLLSIVVALYMLFNCVGYFQGRMPYLVGVTCLVLADMALQIVIQRWKGRRSGDDDEDL